MSTLSVSDESGEPLVPPDSPGSSVSSRFQEEYDELLKFAVVVPSYDPRERSESLTDKRDTFPHLRQQPVNEMENLDMENTITEDGDTSTEVEDIEDQHENDHYDAGSLHDERPSLKRDLHQSTPLEHTPDFPQSNRKAPPISRQSDDAVAGKLFEDTDSYSGDIHQSCHIQEDMIYSSGVDPDIEKMEGLLDTWTTELKRNVLAEFAQSRIKSIEQHRNVVLKEKERHAAHVNQLQNEIESLKELLHTYEQSIERKDQVIENLTHGLQKQKEKLEVAKSFSDWKIKHNDSQREEFAANLAMKHYHHTLTKKCWDGWHNVLENRWKERVEKACQAKASEVCISLTNDYESRISSLNEALESSRLEVGRLHAERDRYEETMKKAFMRGVCALNMEAMSMFNEQENQGTNVQPPTGDDNYPDEFEDDGDGDMHAPSSGYTIPQMPVYNTEPPGAPPPRVVSTQSTLRSQSSHATKATTSSTKPRQSGRGKLISAKVTSRTDSGLRPASTSSTLAPPMSSVVVERHQAINKQTIGHATASQFPKVTVSNQQYSTGQAVIVQRKIAGQVSAHVPLATPNIQNVKVVD